MLFKNKFIRFIFQLLIIILIGGYITSTLIQSTYATNIDKSPNLTVTIDANGNIHKDGDLFEGLLYPATVENAEKGNGGISGVIRIHNQFRKIDVENLAIGLSDLETSNGYPVDEVRRSFLKDVRLKIEKGILFVFNDTLVNYESLEDILYDPDSDEYRGFTLEEKDKFTIPYNSTVDLKYTLHMVPEAGNELESVTAYMPIYINLMENITDDNPTDPGDDDEDPRDDDDDDDRDEEVIIDEVVPLGILNREDHIQYIQGYPDNTVRPEGLITREEVAAVFYRLLDDSYRLNIWTQSANFPDVTSYRWSVRHIGTLANGSIIDGYPDGNFGPGKYITRAELATIASKFDKLTPSTSNMFSDIDDHWASSYINSAALKGWVSGYPDGTFKPDRYITRAEFVTLVNNVLGRKVHKENILPEAKVFPDLLDTAWYYEAMMEAINSHHYTRLEDNTELWIEIYYPSLDM